MLSKKQKQEYFDRRLAYYQSLFTTKIEKALNRQIERYLADFTITVPFFDSNAIEEVYFDLYEAVISNTFATEIGNMRSAGMPIMETRLDDNLRAIIREFFFTSIRPRVQALTQNTTELLQSAINKLISTGATGRDIIKSIRSLNKTRAKTIAETEIVTAMNFASFKAYDFADMPTLEKFWITARDSRVRDKHRAVDGQRRPKNEPFNVAGESLMYPGDPAGSLSNTIRCRCTLSAQLI